MTNNESRDFVSIFSGKGLISSTIMINCSEFAKLTMRIHLLAAAQMIRLACTLPYERVSVRPSVGWSVGPSVTLSFFGLLGATNAVYTAPLLVMG